MKTKKATKRRRPATGSQTEAVPFRVVGSIQSVISDPREIENADRGHAVAVEVATEYLTQLRTAEIVRIIPVLIRAANRVAIDGVPPPPRGTSA